MKTFPNTIPVFPLSGVIYFPKTNLPLNIFEQRYLDLVNDTYKKDKLMGMVQSKKENNLVYKVGCLGKISDYQETSDGRVLFAVPWNNYVVVGTTDTPIVSATDEPIALKKEINFILENAGNYMTKKPTISDVKSVFAGLRPLAASKNNSEPIKEVSRHHKVTVSTSGLISVLGGKWTTYRKIAEDTVNTVQTVGGLSEKKCKTEGIPIFGYDQNTNWQNPLHFYGTEAKKIEKLSKTGNHSLSKKLHITKNQIL